MKLHWIKQDNPSQRLILIFSGWSVDWHLFSRYSYPTGYDVAVVWDYSHLSINILDRKKEYEETIVIAWSFGVAAFQKVYKTLPKKLNINCAIAVNGTTYPVDDSRGIPTDVFAATKAGLSEAGLVSFRRRICGGGVRYRELATDLNAAGNDIESLREQLGVFDPTDERGIIIGTKIDKNLWDKVFLSERDMIFPIANMKSAWSDSNAQVFITGDSHLPDFQRIIDISIRDKSLIAKRFTTSGSTYKENAEVQQHAVDKLIAFLDIQNPSLILEIGSGCGLLSREIARLYPDARFTWIDIADNQPDGCKGNFIHGDAEVIVRSLLPDSFDAVVSANAVQWLHSPLRFLKNISFILKKGGVAALSTFAPGTFQELTELAGTTGLPYLSCEEWIKCAKAAGLTVEKAECETITLDFKNGRELANHLKKTGVNALTQARETQNYNGLRQMLELRECHLTFKPLYLILKK
ncbi:MAG: DUF452 family protein [Muribaculaceae bacterium]|nr:DUF452 family protein [Muribaculaceae bacterium]